MKKREQLIAGWETGLGWEKESGALRITQGAGKTVKKSRATVNVIGEGGRRGAGKDKTTRTPQKTAKTKKTGELAGGKKNLQGVKGGQKHHQ